MSDSFVTAWNVAARLLCPWDFPGKNPGVGCHFLLQGIFLTQGSNPHLLCLLHWQADSTTETPGKQKYLTWEQILPVKLDSNFLATVGNWGQKWPVSYHCATKHPKTPRLKTIAIYIIARKTAGNLGGSSALRWAPEWVCSQVWAGLVALLIWVTQSHVLSLAAFRMVYHDFEWEKSVLLNVFSPLPAR